MSATFNNDFYQSIKRLVVKGKVRQYFTLPAYTDLTLSNLWLGAPTIIRKYNYSATKNFTLRDIPAIPDGFNAGVLCISFVEETSTSELNQVTRYKLWSKTAQEVNGAVVFLGNENADNDMVHVPFYNGELIKKYFRLELWSAQVPDIPTECYAPILLEDVNFSSSIMSNRTSLQDEATSSNADGEVCTTLSVPFPIVPPLVFPTCSVGTVNS